MSSRFGNENHWDFEPVINLIYSLSIGKEDHVDGKSISNRLQLKEATEATTTDNGVDQGTQLGDFDKIWKYFGQPLNVPPPDIALVNDIEVIRLPIDPSNHEESPPKGVKWRDELEGGDLADNDEGYNPEDLSRLSKQQRKKARRKQRREALAVGVTNGVIVSDGSENELEKESIRPSHLDSESVIYRILHGEEPKAASLDGGVSRLRSGKIYKPQQLSDSGKRPVVAVEPVKIQNLDLKAPKYSAYAAAAAKKAKLVALLHETFIDERQYLNNCSYINSSSKTTEAAEDGIHVFVDASNIMIGFHDALKFSRGQPKSFRTRRQSISFHALSLILERGRPTAKRIVVGSDNFAEMQEAKAIGYETSILDRVHKAKELTPRQIKYKDLNNNKGTGTGTGTGSGSETTAALQYAPEKWVEQAVDEILHLKMMESVVDAAEPAIMVLATGDAAEAEYSGGFLKMVERALAKGWKVELASFRHNTSMAYRRREFRQKWGEAFRMVELDGFVEVLLGDE